MSLILNELLEEIYVVYKNQKSLKLENIQFRNGNKFNPGEQ